MKEKTLVSRATDAAIEAALGGAVALLTVLDNELVWRLAINLENMTKKLGLDDWGDRLAAEKLGDRGVLLAELESEVANIGVELLQMDEDEASEFATEAKASLFKGSYFLFGSRPDVDSCFPLIRGAGLSIKFYDYIEKEQVVEILKNPETWAYFPEEEIKSALALILGLLKLSGADEKKIGMVKSALIRVHFSQAESRVELFKGLLEQ